jgi:hypothetical protein
VKHIYYMTFNLCNKLHGHIGTSNREIVFDCPISSLTDITEAAEFESKRINDGKLLQHMADFAQVSFYSLLRTEETKKDVSKFEISADE